MRQRTLILFVAIFTSVVFSFVSPASTAFATEFIGANQAEREEYTKKQYTINRIVECLNSTSSKQPLSIPIPKNNSLTHTAIYGEVGNSDCSVLSSVDKAYKHSDTPDGLSVPASTIIDSDPIVFITKMGYQLNAAKDAYVRGPHLISYAKWGDRFLEVYNEGKPADLKNPDVLYTTFRTQVHSNCSLKSPIAVKSIAPNSEDALKLNSAQTKQPYSGKNYVVVKDAINGDGAIETLFHIDNGNSKVSECRTQIASMNSAADSIVKRVDSVNKAKKDEALTESLYASLCPASDFQQYTGPGGISYVDDTARQACKKKVADCTVASTDEAERKRCLSKAFPDKDVVATYAQATADAESADQTTLTGSTADSGNEADPTCGTEVTMVGWIICPITTAAIGFADTIWAIFEMQLQTSPLQESGGGDGGAYYEAWGLIRNLANILFVVAFLLVIFSQITNIGLSNYSVKKLLPRMIVVAIAINISFFLVQITIDVANILGSTILDLFKGITPEMTDGKFNFGNLLQDIISIGTAGAVVGIAAAFTASSGLAGPLIMLLFFLLIPAIVGLLAGFLTLVIRSALIPIIAIFAPLAFVAYIFPNGQSIFDKWRKTFTSLLILYPLSAVYYGALKFTASIMINNQGVIERMIGHTLLFMGCFVVLVLALKGNAITGKVFGSIKSGLNKVTSPVQKVGMGVAGGAAALKFAQFKNRDFGTAPTRKRFDPRRISDKLGTNNIGRTLQKFDDSQTTRKKALEFTKDIAMESYDDRLLSGYDGTTGTISDMAVKAAGGDRDKAKVMLDRLQANRKAENLKKSMGTLQAEFAKEKAAGRNTDSFLQNRALTATSDSDRDAALHMAAQTGRSNIIRNIQSDPSYATNSALQTATQEAIGANVSSLVSKAPDLIKGAAPAFDNVTGSQLVNFSEDTVKEYMSYIEKQIKAGNHTAAQSLHSAINDIKGSPASQAEFDGRSGRALNSIVSASTVLSSDPRITSAMSSIGPDGKIR